MHFIFTYNTFNRKTINELEGIVPCYGKDIN